MLHRPVQYASGRWSKELDDSIGVRAWLALGSAAVDADPGGAVAVLVDETSLVPVAAATGIATVRVVLATLFHGASV